MSHYGLFDILGPVMIGPSSSHTAGAAKLGYIAQMLLASRPTAATFALHGSFAKTYRGHGTDKALIGGVLGFMPDDPRIRSAEKYAQSAGLTYRFVSVDLGEVHPNTVKISLTAGEESLDIIGSSVGGGRVVICQINSTEVSFTGDHHTLIAKHEDRPGVVASITTIIADHGLNIATLSVYRNDRGERARLVLETDQAIPEGIVETLLQLPHLVEVKRLPKLDHR